MVERVEFDGGTITVEYALAPKMVVFSHDFATLRDNRGLFTDIASNLPVGYGYVMFDYYDTDETGRFVQIKTFAEQLKRLTVILTWVRNHELVEQVDIIGHALGCIVVAKLNPAGVRSLLLLAPPTTIGDDLEKYTQLAGGKELAGIWKIQRADGVIICVPNSYVTELKHIDGEAELNELALLRGYLIILPSHDEILNDVDYTELIVMPSVHVDAVEDTDHNFDGPGRSRLYELVQKRLLDPKSAGE